MPLAALCPPPLPPLCLCLPPTFPPTVLPPTPTPLPSHHCGMGSPTFWLLTFAIPLPPGSPSSCLQKYSFWEQGACHLRTGNGPPPYPPLLLSASELEQSCSVQHAPLGLRDCTVSHSCQDPASAAVRCCQGWESTVSCQSSWLQGRPCYRCKMELDSSQL